MAFWRNSEHQAGAATVGLVRGESLHVLRGVRDANGRCAVRGEAVVRWDPEQCASLLEERVGWRPQEPLYLAGPSPLMLGKAVSVVVPRHEEGHALVRDTREILHAAQWKASDEAREAAATYFGCSVGDIETYGTSMERWRETTDTVAATLFQVCVPRWGSENDIRVPLSLPRVGTFVLPILLSEHVGSGAGCEAVLHTEDAVSVFTIRRQGVLLHTRSVRCGAADIVAHVQRVLGCTASEAEQLLRLAPTGSMSPANQRLLERVIRQLNLLWTGMFQVFASDILPEDFPDRLLVTGLYPALIAKFFCRPQFLARCVHLPCRVETLPHGQEDQTGIKGCLLAVLEQVTAGTPAARVSRASAGLGLLVQS